MRPNRRRRVIAIDIPCIRSRDHAPVGVRWRRTTLARASCPTVQRRSLRPFHASRPAPGATPLRERQCWVAGSGKPCSPSAGMSIAGGRMPTHEYAIHAALRTMRCRVLPVDRRVASRGPDPAPPHRHHGSRAVGHGARRGRLVRRDRRSAHALFDLRHAPEDLPAFRDGRAVLLQVRADSATAIVAAFHCSSTERHVAIAATGSTHRETGRINCQRGARHSTVCGAPMLPCCMPERLSNRRRGRRRACRATSMRLRASRPSCPR